MFIDPNNYEPLQKFPCAKCGEDQGSPVILLASTDGTTDCYFLRNSVQICENCGYCADVDQMQRYADRAHCIIGEYRYARRRYHNDATVADAIRVPFRLWVSVFRCFLLDQEGVQSLDVCSMGTVLADHDGNVDGNALVRVPASLFAQYAQEWFQYVEGRKPVVVTVEATAKCVDDTSAEEPDTAKQQASDSVLDGQREQLLARVCRDLQNEEQLHVALEPTPEWFFDEGPLHRILQAWSIECGHRIELRHISPGWRDHTVARIALELFHYRDECTCWRPWLLHTNVERCFDSTITAIVAEMRSVPPATAWRKFRDNVPGWALDECRQVVRDFQQQLHDEEPHGAEVRVEEAKKRGVDQLVERIRSTPLCQLPNTIGMPFDWLTEDAASLHRLCAVISEEYASITLRVDSPTYSCSTYIAAITSALIQSIFGMSCVAADRIIHAWLKAVHVPSASACSLLMLSVMLCGETAVAAERLCAHYSVGDLINACELVRAQQRKSSADFCLATVKPSV